jgi:hypothetical protein
MNTRAFLLASLIAGVVMGLLGGLPLISVLNCVLCMWVWLSAILAVVLYRSFEGSHPRVTTGQGALLGLVSGIIGAVVVWLISLLSRNAAMGYISQILTSSGVNLPSGVLQAGIGFFSLFFDLILYAIFGAIGGLIGAAIFKGPEPAPAATTVVPPPAPVVTPVTPAPAPVVEPEPQPAAQPEPPAETPPAEPEPPAEAPAETEPPAESEPPAQE